MSDLKPCPFCGGDANAIPSEHADDCYFMVMRNVKLNKDSADCSFVFDAIEAWNRRAQPAQAVPASCGECGKKTSDGWALYCVACMEEAGLPGGTSSPPLTHSCTSSLVRTADSTAQAVPLLSDAEMGEIVNANWGVGVSQMARAIEQAVRSKLGVAVPMTDAQIAEFQEEGVFWQSCKHIVRDIEKFHGIVGKEGA